MRISLNFNSNMVKELNAQPRLWLLSKNSCKSCTVSIATRIQSSVHHRSTQQNKPTFSFLPCCGLKNEKNVMVRILLKWVVKYSS